MGGKSDQTRGTFARTLMVADPLADTMGKYKR
jgi:hypothetical protein